MGMPPKNDTSKWSAVAGFGSGVVTAIVFHPVDMIKTRLQMQMNHGTYRNFFDAIKTVVNKEGLRVLYQGLSPNVAGNALAWSSHYYIYNLCKHHLLTSTGNLNSDRQLSNGEHFISASVGGLCGLILTNPIWVIKTRMCIHSGLAVDHSSITNSKKPGITNQFSQLRLIPALRYLWTTEGMRGWYRGFVPGLGGVMHAAVQFMMYDQMKMFRLTQLANKNIDIDMPSKMPTTYSSMSTALSPDECMVIAAVSKIIACVTTYPYQVIRSRTQGENVTLTTRQCAAATYQVEGLQGFYRGLLPTLMKVTPNAMLLFVIYEQIMSLSHIPDRTT